MDLQERYQLDAAHLQAAKEKVSATARPWRYIFALILAVIAAAISVQARHVAAAEAIAERRGQAPQSPGLLQSLGHTGNVLLSYGAAIAFCLLASAVIIAVGNKARGALQEPIGSAHAAVIRFTIVLVGGLATIVITLQLLDIPITQLIVGGALTGVLVGIAAQQSLSNVFAGIVLLMANRAGAPSWRRRPRGVLPRQARGRRRPSGGLPRQARRRPRRTKCGAAARSSGHANGSCGANGTPGSGFTWCRA